MPATSVCCCSICLVVFLILLIALIASAISMIMSYAIMIWDRITGRRHPQGYIYPQPHPQKAYYCRDCGRQLGFVDEDRWYCYACRSYVCYGQPKKKAKDANPDRPAKEKAHEKA